jgi:hypothetical protein
MPTAKVLALSLLLAGFSSAAPTGNSSNLQASGGHGVMRPAAFVATMQQQVPSVALPPVRSLSQQSAPRGQALATNKGTILLLFAALAAYQLRRNDRSLHRRLSSH